MSASSLGILSEKAVCVLVPQFSCNHLCGIRFEQNQFSSSPFLSLVFPLLSSFQLFSSSAREGQTGVHSLDESSVVVDSVWHLLVWCNFFIISCCVHPD